MTVVYHRDLVQGSEEWLAARCGLMTASEMKLIVAMEGGGTVTNYRASGNTPENLTAKRAQALDRIGDRVGTVRELAFIADVSDGMIRDLVKAGAIEPLVVNVPLSMKATSDDKERAHLYELLAQRVNRYVEPHYQSYDMERGNFDEEHARAKYAATYAPVTECGFITNDRLGVTLGYSPDGLVGDDGEIEVKSRIQKWQMQTLIEAVATQTVPADFMIQVQTGLLVSERKWCDFVSYSGGMMMATVRAYPIPEFQEAIGNAAVAFEKRLSEKLEIYNELLASDARLVPTERLVYL